MDHSNILKILQKPFPIDKTSLKKLKQLKFLIKKSEDANFFIQNNGKWVIKSGKN